MLARHFFSISFSGCIGCELLWTLFGYGENQKRGGDMVANFFIDSF